MAYPSDNKPRRRLQAVPTMQQMIRRRAASPGGVLRKNGPGLVGRMPSMPKAATPARLNATGVSLKPPPGPGGGQAGPGPVTAAPPKPAYSGVNPNQLLYGAQIPENRRNPLEHLDWWAAHGWVYNKNTGRFRYVGGAQPVPPGTGSDPKPDPTTGGGGAPPPYTIGPWDPSPTPTPTPGGGGGGGTPAPGGGPGGGGGSPGDANNDGVPDNLPLDAYFEAQRRQLNDALMARLGLIAPMREQVAANQGLQSARIDTNEGVDTRHLLESLASRGAFGGGIQTRDQGYLGTDYLRTRQDLAQTVAQQYADLARQESEARLGFSSGLTDALLGLANRQAMSQYAVTPGVTGTAGLPAPVSLLDPGLGVAPAPAPAPAPAGGGGGWTPTWKPTWKPTWQPSWQPKGR